MERFDRKGLHQLQNSFVADEDLCDRNVLLLTSFVIATRSAQIFFFHIVIVTFVNTYEQDCSWFEFLHPSLPSPYSSQDVISS